MRSHAQLLAILVCGLGFSATALAADDSLLANASYPVYTAWQAAKRHAELPQILESNGVALVASSSITNLPSNSASGEGDRCARVMDTGRPRDTSD